MSLYVVGKIIGCFGVRGDVKVQPTTHSLKRLAQLQSVSIGVVEGDVLSFDVDWVELRDRVAVVRFKQVPDRTAAEKLVGMYLFVQEADVAAPDQGSFFTHDIIGCEVFANDQRYIGVVEDVQRMPAQDIWVIKNGTKRHMIPAVKEFVKSVNVKERKIIIEVIEDLLDE
jgi:16S rRNA processing protein RimM